MEITGKIYQVLPEQSGKSSKGEWKKQEFIIETQEQYPRKVCIINWNDKVDIKNLEINTMVKVLIDIESREYNGRWFTDVKAWKLEISEKTNIEAQEPANIANDNTDDLSWESDNKEDENDILPF